MRVTVIILLVMGAIFPSPASAIGKELRDLLEAFGEIGRQYNEAANQRNAVELLLFGGPGHATIASASISS